MSKIRQLAMNMSMKRPTFSLVLVLIAVLTMAVGNAVPTVHADATSTSFVPDTVELANIGDMATITVTTDGVDSGVDTFQLNLQLPSTLEISNPACTGIFAGGFAFGAVTIPGVGTLTGCTLIGGANGTTGDVMTFEIARVGAFIVPQQVTFGLGGAPGSQFFIAGAPVGLGATNTLTVNAPVAVGIENLLEAPGFEDENRYFEVSYHELGQFLNIIL